MAIRAVDFDRDILETNELRWNEDLTAKQRAQIAAELESTRNVPEYRWVKVRDLYIDETYQRPVSRERVWDIVQHFNWRLFQCLWVADRKNTGKLFIVDGRHRFSAAQIFGEELMPEIPCEIRKTASVEEEARIFVELQEKRRRLTSVQRFQAKLLYHDPEALEIQRLLSKYRFKVQDPSLFSSQRYTDNVITAIGTLEMIYHAGGRKAVDKVLYFVRTAWDGVAPTQSSQMLRSVARALELKPGADLDRWCELVSQKDPWGLIERGQRFGHSNGIPQSEATAEVLASFI